MISLENPWMDVKAHQQTEKILHFATKKNDGHSSKNMPLQDWFSMVFEFQDFKTSENSSFPKRPGEAVHQNIYEFPVRRPCCRGWPSSHRGEPVAPSWRRKRAGNSRRPRPGLSGWMSGCRPLGHLGHHKWISLLSLSLPKYIYIYIIYIYIYK